MGCLTQSGFCSKGCHCCSCDATVKLMVSAQNMCVSGTFPFSQSGSGMSLQKSPPFSLRWIPCSPLAQRWCSGHPLCADRLHHYTGSGSPSEWVSDKKSTLGGGWVRPTPPPPPPPVLLCPHVPVVCISNPVGVGEISETPWGRPICWLNYICVTGKWNAKKKQNN